jgi:hypothetical protein
LGEKEEKTEEGKGFFRVARIFYEEGRDKAVEKKGEVEEPYFEEPFSGCQEEKGEERKEKVIGAEGGRKQVGG